MFGVNTSVPPPPIVNVPRKVSPPNLMENTNPDVRFFLSIFRLSINVSYYKVGMHILFLKLFFQRYFHPISPSYNNLATNQAPPVLVAQQSNPVDLHVTNLDQNIDSVEMKNILFNTFREHVMVCILNIVILKCELIFVLCSLYCW